MVKERVAQTYEQAFQGLFTTGTSPSVSGKPKKRSVAKLGLKTMCTAPLSVLNHPAGHKPIKNERNHWKKNRDDQHLRSQRQASCLYHY
jgi:hypothetical protein